MISIVPNGGQVRGGICCLDTDDEIIPYIHKVKERYDNGEIIAFVNFDTNKTRFFQIEHSTVIVEL